MKNFVFLAVMMLGLASVSLRSNDHCVMHGFLYEDCEKYCRERDGSEVQSFNKPMCCCGKPQSISQREV